MSAAGFWDPGVGFLPCLLPREMNVYGGRFVPVCPGTPREKDCKKEGNGGAEL